MLAELLFVRCAPVSERDKACKDAKATKNKEPKQANTQTEPNHTKPKKKHETPHPKEVFAASETSET